MPSSPVTNIAVKLAVTRAVSISGQRDGHQLSFFIDPETYKPIDDTLYKNPLPSVSRDSNKWFATRKLSQSTKVNAEIVAEMLDHANANGLVTKAQDKEAVAEQRRVAKLEKQIRDDVMREVMPEGQTDAWALVRELTHQLRVSSTANDAKAQALINKVDGLLIVANHLSRTRVQPLPAPLTPEGIPAEETKGAPPPPSNDFMPRS